MNVDRVRSRGVAQQVQQALDDCMEIARNQMGAETVDGFIAALAEIE